MSLQVLVCLTTVSSSDEAEAIAEALIDQQLAACVQIDGPIRSHYRWQGEQHCDTEYRLVIKTATNRQDQLREALRQLHPYDEPQIVTLASVDADPGYARWVLEQTR